jgi:hypothetical protein
MATKIIICTSGTDPRLFQYLQPDGSWGLSSTAQSFKSFKLAELCPAVACGDGVAVKIEVQTEPSIEAHGVKGMKSTPWRKTFRNAAALNAWCEKNSAVVHGTRTADAK